MTSTTTDRRQGTYGSGAIKLPCRAATTANITLSGEQTIDGVAVVTGDRVLVKDQTTGSENGIYVADTGTWTRARDFDGTNDCVQGTFIYVVSGTTNSDTIFRLTTSSPVIGTSSLSFSATGASALQAVSAFIETLLDDTTAAAARTTLGAMGLTGNETVAGNKVFTGATDMTGGSLVVPTAAAGDNDTSAASTAFVQAAFLPPPQGRLTLVTAVPVMISSQASKTTIFYTPYVGNRVPIYNGTIFLSTIFTELSNDTTASSTGKAGPAAVTTNSNYDLFVWNDSGTIRLTRGPAWSSDTARGTGAGTTELERILGIWTNKVDITNGPTANKGTYVGTVRSDGSSQINWIPGAVAANGTAGVLGVWNAYNRVDVRGGIGDTTASWSYATSTARPANNSTTMRVSFVQGLQEDFFNARYQVAFSNNFTQGGGTCGVGYDSTTAYSLGTDGYATNPATVGSAIYTIAGEYAAQGLGFHYMQALEAGNGAGTQTWGSAQNLLSYHGRF